MPRSELAYVPLRVARNQVRDSDLLLFHRRGLISIAGRGDHSHAAKAAWWGDDLSDWRPSRWNQAPPQATALELVEDRLYGAREAALFVEGFNRAVIDGDRSVWAVAVPITVRYLGDVEPGMSVVGYVFAESLAGEVGAGEIGAESPGSGQGDHFQGFGQSPQRSR